MNALAMASIFFLSSFADLSVVAPVILMAAMSRSTKEDRQIRQWLETYNCPNQNVLWITKKKFKTQLATVLWPREGEEVQRLWQGEAGLIIMDGEPFKNKQWFIGYVVSALSVGGTCIFLDGDRVLFNLKKTGVMNLEAN